MFISFRVLHPCVYLGPGVYKNPASIRINRVFKFEEDKATKPRVQDFKLWCLEKLQICDVSVLATF